ncbi:hypothetical protein JD844_003916 [Phrynosoma platyrhinos]|uniref:Uncharacterized protein n=1 Tax=Phrynosoma platyrhinos TaxID=52577 RepID=A0ABQ7TM42_PHRPL|nr:hypothetical protein JD844_003916 [Phrynosoma platyrhinos]
MSGEGRFLYKPKCPAFPALTAQASESTDLYDLEHGTVDPSGDVILTAVAESPLGSASHVGITSPDWCGVGVPGCSAPCPLAGGFSGQLSNPHPTKGVPGAVRVSLWVLSGETLQQVRGLMASCSPQGHHSRARKDRGGSPMDGPHLAMEVSAWQRQDCSREMTLILESSLEEFGPTDMLALRKQVPKLPATHSSLTSVPSLSWGPVCMSDEDLWEAPSAGGTEHGLAPEATALLLDLGLSLHPKPVALASEMTSPPEPSKGRGLPAELQVWGWEGRFPTPWVPQSLPKTLFVSGSQPESGRTLRREKGELRPTTDQPAKPLGRADALAGQPNTQPRFDLDVEPVQCP